MTQVSIPDPSAAIKQVIGFITGWIITFVAFGLALLLLGTVAAHFGFRIPFMPAISDAALAWLCGAFFLYRGGKIT